MNGLFGLRATMGINGMAGTDDHHHHHDILVQAGFTYLGDSFILV